MEGLLKLFGTFGFFIVIFSACETDFDTTAPYQDITVVYGLLDPKDSMQYIKINKAFLSEDNVLRYAFMEDSNSYPFPLVVSVEEWTQSGDSVTAYYFDTTTIFNKEPGLFYYPEQVVYKWQKPSFPSKIEPILDYSTLPPIILGYEYFWLNEDNIYKLKINNPETDKVISAETPLLKDVEFTKPQNHIHTIRFVPNPQTAREWQWRAINNAGKYEFELRFNFREVEFNSNDTIDRYVTLAKSSQYAGSGSTVSTYFWDDRFFTGCLNLIPYASASRESEVKDRFSGMVNLIVSVADKEFSYYLQVNEPSTSIIQEKPQYSNIENGIGLFSSRIRKTRYLKLHSESLSDLQSIQDNALKFRY